MSPALAREATAVLPLKERNMRGLSYKKEAHPSPLPRPSTNGGAGRQMLTSSTETDNLDMCRGRRIRMCHIFFPDYSLLLP